MLFYKVTALITDEEWIKESKDRNIRDEFADRIKDKTDEFNERTGDGVYCFVSYIDGKKMICGIVSSGSSDADKIPGLFIEAVGAKAGSVKTDEITFSSAYKLMEKADCNHYIEDENDIVERYGLEKINKRHYCSLEYDEKLAAEHLERAWNGAFLAAAQEGNEHEETV